MKHAFSHTAVAVIFFSIGIVLQERAPHLLFDDSADAAPVFRQVRQSEYAPQRYSYINPLLACESAERREASQLEPVKKTVEGIVADALRTKDAAAVSVYFDQRDGNWIGVNTGEKYFPASLLKVPLMMAIYKKAETEPAFLSKKIRYGGHDEGDFNAMEYFAPTDTIRVGQTYTIGELTERMIVHSDNNTLPFLVNQLTNQEIEDVLNDLGVQIVFGTQEQRSDFVTVKTYANFFRTLYNGSYLNRAMSERALEVLSKAEFRSGLTGPVPPHIAVAYKFGERGVNADRGDTPSERELHDCGIVYYPGHPYLLCVMTKGADFERLSAVIREISSRVYEEVDAAARGED